MFLKLYEFFIFVQVQSSKNRYFSNCLIIQLTWTAVSAATIAGDPNPCVIIEKWVKWRWILGSRICWGLVLHNGLRSWFNKSINSLTITLQIRKNMKLLLIFCSEEMSKCLTNSSTTPKSINFSKKCYYQMNWEITTYLRI